jgi:lipoic acid synthetase
MPTNEKKYALHRSGARIDSGVSTRLPEWVKVKNAGGLRDTRTLLRRFGLATVCEEARCPNRSACFSIPTAAFMILGSKCTRNCAFCAVDSAFPEPPDQTEPARVAMASKEMRLRYVVITSVTRDDLYDGGAGHFAETVSSVRTYVSGGKIEVLTPDFKGNRNSIDAVLQARPDVYNHNIETVSRLYPVIRPAAEYGRSLALLEYAKKTAPDIYTKSGLMLGLGEDLDEVMDALRDLRNAGCDFITIGQYLRPSKSNLPVVEYIHPGIFEKLRLAALSMGFKYAASGPLVRSSMNAENMYNRGESLPPPIQNRRS